MSSLVNMSGWIYNSLGIADFIKIYVNPFDNNEYKIVDDDEQIPISYMTAIDGNKFYHTSVYQAYNGVETEFKGERDDNKVPICNDDDVLIPFKSLKIMNAENITKSTKKINNARQKYIRSSRCFRSKSRRCFPVFMDGNEEETKKERFTSISRYAFDAMIKSGDYDGDLISSIYNMLDGYYIDEQVLDVVKSALKSVYFKSLENTIGKVSEKKNKKYKKQLRYIMAKLSMFRKKIVVLPKK